MRPVSAIRTDLSSLDPCIVVEDDSIIMLDIEHTLRQLGLSDLRTATTLARGETLAKLPGIRCAILDYELGHLTTSVALAEALAGRGIPVIFLTAYGADVELPASLAQAPVLAKPFTTAMLLQVLIDVTLGSQPQREARLCG